MRRKAIPVKTQIDVAIRQAHQTAFTLAGVVGFQCPLCKLLLSSGAPRILEHMVPHATMVALGKDPDAVDNLAWVHAECAAKKTNGNKATCADGDTHKIGKAKRLHVAQMAKSKVEVKLTKEKWRLKKKVDGTVVRVRTA